MARRRSPKIFLAIFVNYITKLKEFQKIRAARCQIEAGIAKFVEN